MSGINRVVEVLNATVGADCKYSVTGSVPASALTAKRRVRPGSPGQYDGVYPS
jgi:hypothetical protein